MAYVLIIDDDEDFASAAAQVMEASGHETEVKLDPASGLQSMKDRQPDLVILDVMFPEDSSAGFALARAMHSQVPELAKIPVLMLTAVNAKFPLGFSSKDIDDVWMPISAFVEKPVELSVLKQKVEALLAGVAQADSSSGDGD